MNKYYRWTWITLGVAIALGLFASALKNPDRSSTISVFSGVAILVFIYRFNTDAKPLNRYMWVMVVTLFQLFQQLSTPSKGYEKSYTEAFVVAGAVGVILTVIVLAYDFFVKPLWQKLKPAEKVLPSTPDLLLAAADGDTTQIETLIAEGASVNTLGPNGETALMLAIRNGKREVVELLLANGADVHVKTPKGSTALSVAKHFKQTEIEGLLQGIHSAKH